MLFQRFAAATAVASAAISVAAFVVLLMPRLTFERIYPITGALCFVPLVWGLWALLAPPAFMPKRLPLWGMILGVILGSFGAFVLNGPSRLFGTELPLKVRGGAVLVTALFYYALWTLVRATYRSLATVPERERRG